MVDQRKVGEKTRHRRSIDRRLREVGEALEALAAIDADWLWEFQRRREMSAVPDGLGSARGDGGSKSADETTTTERAALARPAGCAYPRFVKLAGIKEPYCGKCGQKLRDHAPDPIGAAVEEVFELLDTATLSLRTLARRGVVVLKQADGYRGRQSTLGQCAACGTDVSGQGEDRIKAGYGPCCYSAWMRWSKVKKAAGEDPSHVVFRWYRRNELAERVDQEAS